MNDNGSGAELSELDAKLIRDMQTVLDEQAEHETQLRRELDDLLERRRRYERAMTMIRGQKLGAGGKPAPTPSKPAAGTKLGAETLGEIRSLVLAISEDMEEFRQVDVRTRAPNPRLANSSVMSSAFGRLREEGFIRLARSKGNEKWFRLTRPALAEAQERVSDGR